MGKVIFDISMSTDGYVGAANIRPEESMANGDPQLREWASGGADIDQHNTSALGYKRERANESR